jgi:tRNA threonylcarbamoyladenosine modification (KEOPS) complex  Pcc1 subunit
LEATLALEYDDEKVAEAVAAAISPDNYKTPADLTVKTVRKQNVVVTEISAKGKMISFIATIDDLLFSVSTAEKTLRTIQKG